MRHGGVDMSRVKKTIQPDWISKTLAGAVLGIGVALACSGLLSLALAGLTLPVRGQLVMWVVPLIALAVWSGVYLFRSGLSAWLWLGGANLLSWGALGALRFWIASAH